MKKGAGFVLFVLLLAGKVPDAAAQVRPPTITSVSPAGAQRGTMITLTVDGANLAGASSIEFSHAALTGEITNVIDLPFQPVIRPRGFTGAPIEDLFSLHRILAKVRIASDTPTGRHNFRIKTSLGTTNLGSLHVGSLVEISEAEPNDAAAQAHRIFFPSTVVGTIARSGDEDLFEFDAEAGRTLVFEVLAAAIGSALDPELELLDEGESVLVRNKDYAGRPDSFLAHTFTKTGTYRIRVADSAGGGSNRHFYRLNLGELPFVSTVFPMGVRKGTRAELHLEGFNLADRTKLTVEAPAEYGYGETIPVEPVVRGRASLNRIRVAIGEHPEVFEEEGNDLPSSAQPVTLPVCVNGRIDGSGGAPDNDVYRLSLKKGHRVAMSVLAQRLGSPLDSVIEVLDAAGRIVPRVVARPVWQTFVTLNDPGSLQRGMRIDSWSSLAISDYVMVGNELLQIEELPKNPDDDIKFRSYRGVRIGYEGTTPEAHAMNTPVYKVELHAPGGQFAPNGMPIYPIGYLNDDGGQISGKDSYLLFEAPADGAYFVRIRDVRGLQGREFVYRLILSEPRPDFALTVDPKNPNIPLGDSVPLTVTVARFDGFDGPIALEVTDLPPGVTAAPGTILHGAATATLMLKAAADTQIPGGRISFRVRGKAEINGRVRECWADNAEPGDDSVSWLSVTTEPEILVSSVEPGEILLEPGQEAPVTVTISRRRGFAGRVPVEVRNLPLGVFVPDIGLNGILITESDTERTFHIRIDPRTAPLEQTLYLVARIENNSPTPSEHGSVPLKLKVVQKPGGVSQK